MDFVKKILQTTWNVWRKIAHGIGWVNSRIILTVLFVVLFGIYHIVSRVFEIFVKRKPEKRSMWTEKPYKKPTIASVERQF